VFTYYLNEVTSPFADNWTVRTCTERTILLKENFSWIQNRKVILLNYQNNDVERSNYHDR